MRGGLKPVAEETGLQAKVDAELDAYLRRDTRAPIALGLSGGGDSLALLHFAAAWAARAGRPLLALTVDHGLSASSAEWTAGAGAMASAAGARWRRLEWAGPKPRAGLPAAARRARHALLAEATREANAAVLLLAHTADDVAEGDWMREVGAAPTLGRLRAFGPSPAWPQGRDVFLLRPLLAVSRVALRDWLRQRNLGWIDDPANADARFARSRARTALAVRPLQPREPCRELAPADASRVTQDAAGALRLNLADLRGSPKPARLLATALLCAGGGDRPPASTPLARMMKHLSSDGATATLAGARACVDGGAIHITREPGRRPPPSLRLDANAPVVWDGRFEIAVSAPGWTVTALAGLAARLPDGERRKLTAIDPAARRMAPVFLSPQGEARLAPPFGMAPAAARPLALDRLRAALGEIACEP